MKSQEIQWLLEDKYGGEKSSSFFTDCERLAAGEPLGYVIGHIPFLNCQIWLDSKPLIPRPETEFWVELAISGIKKMTSQAPSVLDLCAGSGCIGTAVAKAVPVVNVDFSEIDVHHLPTIEKNLKTNGINPYQSNIIQSDLFQNVTKKYDFILSNPPYIDPVLDRTETAVKSHEPHLALYGGQNGLELINKIITTAPTHLNPEGQLWLEHEPEQSAAIKHIGGSQGFTVITYNDQYKVERYSILVLQ